MHQFLQQLLIGIQLGSMYALIALGYTMVYGVLKLINFAHGDVYMIGAYAGLGAAVVLGSWASSHLHMSLVPSPLGFCLVIFAAMIICGVLGLIIEQAAYRPLRSRVWITPAVFIGAAVGYIAYCIGIEANLTKASAIFVGIISWIAIALLLKVTQARKSTAVASRLTALITAIGVSLFLENFGVLPQILSADPQFYGVIKLLNIPARMGENAPTMIMLAVAILLMAGLTYVVTRTKIGKAIRAVSYDPDAASLMGIHTDRVIAFTFALGSALAGAAGVMVTYFAGTGFTPYAGIQPGLKAFVAAVLGGIGNIPGAALGGLIMGLAETFVVAYGSYIHVPDTYRDAVAFLLLILILLFRPSGLLGKVAVEKV
jgi:branched-chain amino acid transport system permease protein